MRYGLMVGEGSGDLDAIAAEIGRAEEQGMASCWMSQVFGYDAIVALSVSGRGARRIELGTAVVPTFPRHPLVMASQALTAQAALGQRFVLGVGLSHQVVVEQMLGLGFERPAEHMEEYLVVLGALVREGSVSFQGRRIACQASLQVPGSSPCPILVAALGPRMLGLAGRLADGTITWMTGPRTVADHIVPGIGRAASAAGRPSPRVVVGIPVCVTSDPEAARQRAASVFSFYGQLPSYRAMLDREGVASPADVAVVGDEEAVAAQLARFAEGGASDLAAAVFARGEERKRTLELLSSLART
ncbi:MAG TPA: LLM class F420-dependent oxidoreductase [Acidimicrobiales bacterium]|nr:LLM class F420-dependent oxidoreductase [Acidimicrobiales bacterium]